MPDNPIKIAISLGANLGDAASAIQKAASELERSGVSNARLSKLFLTKPVNCPPGTPDFLNAAMTGYWNGTATSLLLVCQTLEIAAGRPRNHGLNQSRPLDLDIILFGDITLRTQRLIIPHPLARRRRFVLEPLAEIAPHWRFPEDGMTIIAALNQLSG